MNWWDTPGARKTGQFGALHNSPVRWQPSPAAMGEWNVDPIFVKPKDAFAALGVGHTKGYEMIAAKELEAVKIGRATRITVASVQAKAAQLLEQSRAGA